MPPVTRRVKLDLRMPQTSGSQDGREATGDRENRTHDEEQS